MSNQSKSTGINTLTAVGVAVAVQISWAFNAHVGWAIFHGLLGWFYVLYRVLFAGLPG